MYESLEKFLKDKDVEFYRNFNTAPLSSIKIGGTVKYHISPIDIYSLVDVLSFLEKERIGYIVVGMMTNSLIKDSINDIVVVNCSKINRKTRAENIMYAQCGAKTSSVIMEMVNNGYGGASGLAGIPGTLGGALCGNAGAFGYEISQCFISGRFFSKTDRSVVRMDKEDLCFSYRDSILKKGDLVFISGLFAFAPDSKEKLLSEISAYAKRRVSTQPTGYPSLGSVFKRHEGIGAGFFIDKAGLKGYRIGDAMISEKHAGFIVNVGNATSDDIIKLIDYVKERVYSVFNILLEEEIRIF